MAAPSPALITSPPLGAYRVNLAPMQMMLAYIHDSGMEMQA